jgi:hypothetical protein
MARAPKGSLRPRGDRWLASVPMLADPKKRVEYSFATEAAGQRWIDEQLARRVDGNEPEKPANRGVASLRAVGWECQLEVAPPCPFDLAPPLPSRGSSGLA